MHSAKPLPRAALGKEPPVKNLSAKNSLPSAFYRALGKVGTEKKPEKNGGKMEFFLIGGGPHRPAPAHLWYFSSKFRSNTADRIRTRDLPLRANLLYHYTTLSLVPRFRFSSQHSVNCLFEALNEFK